MRNHSYENEFRLQVHFHANQTHFHLNGFALRLVLKQRHKGTGKGPIVTAKKNQLNRKNKITLLISINVVFGC